jgi:ABC-type Fe3+-hydroxamate transport system substrate-binding protein
MVVLNMDSPNKVLEAYTKLGDIFHREDIATSIVTGSSDAISNALDKGISSGAEKKKVLYLRGVYEIPLSGSLENNILTECHTLSIWDIMAPNVLQFDDTGSYAGVSKEQITEFDPDVIICKTDVAKRTIERDLPDIDAVKNKKVFSIEESNYHFEFDEYHSIPAMVWVIKKTYDLDTPDPDKFYKWYLSATKFNHKF